MAWTTQAKDWAVLGICQMGGAAFAGGGIWFFDFKSLTAEVSSPFIFIGAGLGLGGSLGGGYFPDLDIFYKTGKAAVLARGDEYTWLNCENAFSAADLNMAFGRLSTAGVGVALGYGFTFLSAGKGILKPKSLFLSQSCGGWGTGVGASAITTIGVWQRLG